MNPLDTLLFICRYIPFWAIPCFFMGMHFGYTYWLKDHRRIAVVCMTISLFCLTALALFYLMGGPDQMANTITRIFM